MRRFLPVTAVILVLLSGSIAHLLDAQVIDMDAARAREEFRWGVEAYHAARFNDAIVAFNRAISFTPEEHRIREWLGRSYFRAGFEDAAINEWEIIADNAAAGAYLQARLEILRYRRGVMPFQEPDPSFSRSRILRGEETGATAFRRPTGVSAHPDGDVFVVSLGTQEILQVSPNGRVRDRLRGGLQGLNRPFDVIWHDRELYVTEFGSNRIAVLDERGLRVRHFGERGLTEGALVGPQYLALDGERELLYITDWGGRRVSVFTLEGEFVLSFGRETIDFAGLVRPTGIAVQDDLVYVADHNREGVSLVVFDNFGNFLERIPLPLGTDDIPSNSVTRVIVEGLSWYDRDHLLITAGRRVLFFELRNRRVVTVIDDAERQRVGSVAVDANGRILITDIDSSEIGFFEPEGTLYSGLDVRIERILNARFPQVALLVAVHDREGRPLVGLSRENFVVSERGIPQEGFRIESTGQSVRELDVSVVLQPGSTESYLADATQAVSDIVTLVPQSERLHLYTAGREPALVLSRPATRERFVERTGTTLRTHQDDHREGTIPLDRALRLAATPLVDRGLRRNIILIGDGTVTDDSFSEYGIQEIGAYLANNDIRLHLVMLESRTPAAELRFLVEETGGSTRYLFEPEGLMPLVTDMARRPSGRYWLTYNSSAFADFGRAYLELAVEARIFVRSGRDELGFFPPPEP